MVEEYLSGDADAAVAFFAGRKTYQLKGDPVPDSRGQRAPQLAELLFTTEVGMRLRTFGKYADSAPLEAGVKDVVGLDGRFELNSLRVYRAVKPVTLKDFARQWHVVTIAYCARWQLHCADTLLASARQDFGETADVLVLSSVQAENRGASGEARTLLERAVAIDPNHVSAHLRLGRLLFTAGRLAEAGRELRSALELARAYGNSGAAYFALTSLADLDARAGLTSSARAQRAEATALKAFAHPYFADLQPEAIYRAGLFYEQPQRIGALRKLAR